MFSATCRRTPPFRPTRRLAWRPGRRCPDAYSIPLVSLPAAPAEYHDGNGASHDHKILRDTSALDVFQIVANLRAHVVDTSIVRLLDLGPSCDTRSGSLPQRILGDVITKAREYAGTLGPRSNDVHLAANDIEQLRNFVNPVLSHDAADARHTGVTFGRPDRALLFGADLHRPQLEDHERGASQVTRAPIVGFCLGRSPAIKTDSSLRVKDRPR